MDIHNQIESKRKAFSVIDSCETTAHILAARNYIRLYLEKFEDNLGYIALDNELNHKSRLISRKEQSYGKE
jgi:hypothetical protein